jgi:KaiC/GvpD/RAD55 family RecA-like ATPase
VQLINKNNIPPLDDTELETAFNSIANKEQEKRNGNVQSNPKIKIISLKELMAKTDIEERYLVNDLILEGSINVISGHPGVGKTWVMLEMARSVASGNKFLDQFDTLQGAVLIIDAESGESKIKKRMTLMKVNDELPIFLASLQGIKVDDQNTSNFILGEAKRLGIKFLIFDPFSAIHSKNENSSDEMQKVMEALQEFTLNGITVLFLHHHRKESSQYPNSNAQGLRGSSLILSRVDSMSIITSKDEGQSIRIKFSQEKMRSKRKLKPFDIFLDENEFGVDMKYAGEVGTDMGKFDLALELIPEILLVEGGKTTKEILELAKEAEEIGDKTMLMAIKKLVDVKTILKTKQGKENFYTHARLLKNTEIKEESLAE